MEKNDQITSSKENQATVEPLCQFSSSYTCKCRRTTFFLGFFVLFLLLVALTGGYFYYLYPKQTDWNNKWNELETRLAANQKDMANLQMLIDTQARQIIHDHALIDQLNANRGQDQKIFLLQEAYDLVRMALFSLYIQHDVPETLALLDQADLCLQNLGQRTTSPLRLILSKNITDLKNLPQISFNKLYMQIEDINRSIDGWPFFTEKSMAMTETGAETGAQGKADWLSTMHYFKQLLIIRHDEEPLQPFFRPYEQNSLRLMLHLLCIQAQTALMQGHPTLYQNSLQQLNRLAQRYFNTEDGSIKEAMKKIADLSDAKVAIQWPDLYPALDAMARARGNT